MDGIGRNRISIELCLVEYRVGLRRGLEFFGIVTEVQDSARSGLKPDFSASSSRKNRFRKQC